MIKMCLKEFLMSSIALLFVIQLSGGNGRYRIMWRTDPATSMVIGWDQYSGNNPVLFLDTKNNGRNPKLYPTRTGPDEVRPAKGMNNHFVRLSNLKPNTVYYFIIQDSEGISPCFSFKTAPNTADNRLSIIAGGDSRNNRPERILANKLVSKLRPHFIVFAGDMTDNDSAREWQNWLDDWQETIGSDGRIFPIVPALGNHELTPKTLIEIFDVAAPNAYYAYNFGGNLLRLYTLNSKLASGDQFTWLERDLMEYQGRSIWKFAQYHHAIVPHTKQKSPREDLMIWAKLFHKFEVRLALESDAHVVKWTYPIKPSRAPESEAGFIRDDNTGTVYIGEGCWGAPLRNNDYNKKWTKASGKFNQFKWIFIDKDKIEVRTVKTDGSDNVQEIDHNNIFNPPLGLSLWRPKNGAVVTIKNRPRQIPPGRPAPPGPIPVKFSNIVATPLPNSVKIEWMLAHPIPPANFIIERSTNGQQSFQRIGQKTAEKGKKQFVFSDPNPPSGEITYRIKLMRPKGPPIQAETSCKMAAPPSMSPARMDKIAPDPKSGLLAFSYSLERPSNVVFIIIAPADNRILKSFPPTKKPSGRQIGKLDILDLPKGNYVLLVKAGKDVVKKYQILKK